MIKEKAEWLPNRKLLIRQFIISIFSYLTLPFYKPKENSIKCFFEKNYYIEKDELIFDGTTYSYFFKLKRAIDFQYFIEKNLLELGCGKSSFYYWLKDEGYNNIKYKGIDFAIRDENNYSENFSVYNDDVINIDNYLEKNNNAIIMSNILCYLEEKKFLEIIFKIKSNDILIIIDPSPNLFWDAHFEGIRPYYRKIEKVINLLESQGFEIISIVQDYWMSIFNLHLFPLSYCIIVQKKIQ